MAIERQAKISLDIGAAGNAAQELRNMATLARGADAAASSAMKTIESWGGRAKSQLDAATQSALKLGQALATVRPMPGGVQPRGPVAPPPTVSPTTPPSPPGLFRSLLSRVGFFAVGGPVGASGFPGEPRGSDVTPIWATPGEYIVNRESADANRGLLERINASRGPVRPDSMPQRQPTQYRAMGGTVQYLAAGGNAAPIKPPPLGTPLGPSFSYPSGVQPVYVTNWPPDFGKGGGGGPRDKKESSDGLLAGVLRGAAIYGSIAMAERSVQRVTQAFTVLGDSTQTLTQKNMELVRLIPVVGGLLGSLQDLRRAITGIPDQLRQSNENFAVQAAGISARGGMMGSLDAARARQETEQARAVALRQLAGTAPPPMVAKGATLREQIAFQEQAIRRPALLEQQAAQAGVQAAQGAYEAAQRRQATIQGEADATTDRVLALQRTVRRLRAEENGRRPGVPAETESQRQFRERTEQGVTGGNARADELRRQAQETADPAQRQALIAEATRARAEALRQSLGQMTPRLGTQDIPRPTFGSFVQNAVESARQLATGGPASGNRREAEIHGAINAQRLQGLELDQQLNRLAEAQNETERTGIALAEARNRARQAETQILKAQLEILQQQERRAATAAQSMGALRPLERRFAIRAFRQFQERTEREGPERALARTLPAQLQRIQAIAPDVLRNVREQAGERVIEREGLRRLAPEQFGPRALAELRQQIAEVQPRVEVQMRLNEATLAEEIGRHTGNLVRQLEILVHRIEQRAMDRTHEGLAIQHNQQR